mgnify:CR=1 FL=1
MTHEASLRSYLMTLDDRVIGRIDYVNGPPEPEAWVHTEVVPELRNKGYAAVLLREAVTIARARKVRVSPLCPYVRAYAKRHPKDRDVFVDAGR